MCLSRQAVFTALPLRVLNACATLLLSWRQRVSSLQDHSAASASATDPAIVPASGHQQQSLGPPLPQDQPPLHSISQEQAWQLAGAAGSTAESAAAVQPLSAADAVAPAPADGSQQGQRLRQPPFGMRGDQLFDLICVFIFLMAVRPITCVFQSMLELDQSLARNEYSGIRNGPAVHALHMVCHCPCRWPPCSAWTPARCTFG